MGQIEVLDFLRDRAEIFPKRRYTVKEIIKGLKNNGFDCSEGSTRRSLTKLSSFGFIDCETIGWNRKFRYLKKR